MLQIKSLSPVIAAALFLASLTMGANAIGQVISQVQNETPVAAHAVVPAAAPAAPLDFAAAQPKKKKNFVRVGTTVFVSGHFKNWSSKLFPGPWEPLPSEEITKRVVFVNTLSENQEKTGLADMFVRKAHNRGISTVVVGRCDLFCARLFMAGKDRTLTPLAYIDLQAPIDYDTKQIETRFPQSQFNIFEQNSAIAAALKDVYFEAFSKGGKTGGLRVTATSAQFCKTRNPDTECKNYPLHSTSMGLSTSSEPESLVIPDELDY